MAIKKDYLIEKRNVLNELRSNNLTLQELRFFSIYLAKINARDISTRMVRFTLSDFQRIMELGKLNLSHLRDTVDSLLSKVVGVPLENRGFKRFQLFKLCVFCQDEREEWYIEIDAHDEALPLMFAFKEQYFTYELWNALRLKSSNQLRMYEILKQYEMVGERIISIDELKSLLGIDASEYARFSDFRCKVLNVCQEALAENTDITFTYEPAKRGPKGKINLLKFTIGKNANHVDQLSFAEFISGQPVCKNIGVNQDTADNQRFVTEFEDNRLAFISEACENEFGEAEIRVLYDLAVKVVPYEFGKGTDGYEFKIYDYIQQKYNELKLRASKSEIKSRFGYLKAIIAAEAKAITARA